MSDPAATVSISTTAEHSASTRRGAVCNPRFRARRLDRRRDEPHADRGEHGVERRSELGVAVTRHAVGNTVKRAEPEKKIENRKQKG
jgi:hypothetical protein